MKNHYQQAVAMKELTRLPVICRLLGRAVYWVTTIAMAISAMGVLVALALISYSVVARYLLGQASLWIDDTVTFILVGIVMCSTAAALREGKHLGVDLFTERLVGRPQCWAQAWSMLAVLVVSVFLVIDGWQTAMFSKMIGMTTLGYVQIPIYWLQLLIPLGGAMLVLVALESLVRLAFGGPAHIAGGQERENQS